MYDLFLDEGNLREMARHRVHPEDLDELMANHPVLLPNRRGHRATHVLIGATDSARFLTVPVECLDSSVSLWRPATAWDSKESEILRYYRAGGQ